jgi:hypothetical protein
MKVFLITLTIILCADLLVGTAATLLESDGAVTRLQQVRHQLAWPHMSVPILPLAHPRSVQRHHT